MSWLAIGFRPFFLLGGLSAALLVGLWLAVLQGGLAVAGPLAGPVWHAHEMLFGFTVAIVAGFLLTAVQNWTGRTTTRGAGLLALAGVWLAGRIAMLAVPGWPASAVDLAFLPALAAVIARPLWATGNRRNAVFPVVLLVLWAANLVVHLDAAGVVDGVAVAANRFALHLILLLVVIVAGRIVPMFTRNATGQTSIASAPALDRLAIAGVVAVTVLTAVPAPVGLQVGVPVVAGVLVALRTWRWGLRFALRDPLLWVLHLGHLSVAMGLLLEGLDPVLGFGRTLALHTLTVGGIGLMTLGMMVRVALGHTGRPLRAPAPLAVAFAVVVGAAVVRVVGPLVDPARTVTWWWIAGGAWVAAFLVYVAVFAPILVTPRADGRPG